jgi:hypothetical protein
MTTLRGGARVGWVNASGPLAALDFSKDRLCLRILAIGTYEFRPEEVVAIEPKKSSFFSGVRIRHAIAKYPKSIVFQPLGAANVIDAIHAAGFTPSAPSPLPDPPVPFRWGTVLPCFALWIVLLIAHSWDFFREFRGLAPSPRSLIDAWTLVPLGLAFAFVWGVRLGPLRPFFLKAGRDFEEIKHWINLLCLIFTLMLPIFSILAYVASRRS